MKITKEEYQRIRDLRDPELIRQAIDKLNLEDNLGWIALLYKDAEIRKKTLTQKEEFVKLFHKGDGKDNPKITFNKLFSLVPLYPEIEDTLMEQAGDKITDHFQGWGFNFLKEGYKLVVAKA